MAQEEKDEIVNLVNKNIPHVELKQSYKIKDTIEIGPYKK